MIDLTEDDAQLMWRQSMARQIDKADNAYAIYDGHQALRADLFEIRNAPSLKRRYVSNPRQCMDEV